MLRCRRGSLFILCAVACLPAARAEAQEPLLDQLERAIKTEALSIGAILQVVGDWQSERSTGENGFSVPTMRAYARGRLDGGFGYRFQMNFVNTPSVLDARLDYSAAEFVTASVGRFKVPFSAEALASIGELDFVRRAQVVNTLAPGRDVGLQAAFDVVPNVGLAVGIFNGNRAGLGNDNDAVLIGGRLQYQSAPAGAADRLVVGFHAAGSSDESVPLGGNLGITFAGTRRLMGADARWVAGRTLVSGEVIVSDLEASVGPQANPLGWQVTAGRMVTERSQLLVRWDAFRGDDAAADSDLLIAGYNVWPTGATKFQVNLAWPTREDLAKRLRLLANAQISF